MCEHCKYDLEVIEGLREKRDQIARQIKWRNNSIKRRGCKMPPARREYWRQRYLAQLQMKQARTERLDVILDQRI